MEAREVTASITPQTLVASSKLVASRLGELGWKNLGPHYGGGFVMESPKETREFSVFTGRKYLKVSEWLGSRENGQRTIRWFKNMEAGQWYVGQSWDRPDTSQRLNAEQAAYVEGLLS